MLQQIMVMPGSTSMSSFLLSRDGDRENVCAVNGIADPLKSRQLFLSSGYYSAFHSHVANVKNYWMFGFVY